MKKFNIIISIVCFSFLVPIGCQKDEVDKEFSENSLFLPRGGDQNTFITGGTADEDTAFNITTLGPTRENPYTVENFTAAYNELYNPDVTSLPITHYYIKFTPTTHDQLDLLANSDLNIVEFPLDREITHLGDFYIEPGTPRGQILPMYAVVLTSQILPQVPYTTLANLYLGSSDETLIRRALTRKGYNPDDIGYIIVNGGGGGGGGEFTVNSCGCQVYSNPRTAGGCIQVKDVQKNTFQGVRRVRVVIKDNFFDFHTIYTDDSGCWKLNSTFYGKAYMWVHFNSETRGKVRGVKTGWASIVQWIFPVKHHVGTINGPSFNNIQVKYDRWTNEGSDAQLYWGAATVGNALHEFYDFAISDGIHTPPSHLDIFVGKHHRYGYSLMSGQDDLVSAIGTIGGVVSSIFAGPFAPVIDLIGSVALALYLPDVYIGINYHESDRLKELAYHEIAHSSHYTNVGEPYWDILVWAEIIAGGHGSNSSANSGIISLVESWAEFIGLTYVSRTYLGFQQTPPQFDTWSNFLERTRNETTNHIPIGFYNDLVDNIPDNGVACDELDGLSCSHINDQANGFAISQMFNLLNISISSPEQFKDHLINGASSTIQDQVNNLFNSY